MSKRKMKANSKKGLSPPRNPFFNHPLMRKSAVHDKTEKAKRRSDKVRFNKDWYSQKGICHTYTFLKIPVLHYQYGFLFTI
jgi:hypothetical protein